MTLKNILQTFLLLVTSIMMLACILLQPERQMPSVQHSITEPRSSVAPLLPIATQPVLVTGFSDNHFAEAQALFQSVHQYLPSYKLIVYDLGLSQSQRELLNKYGRCELRTFNSSLYPPHVKDLHTYSWKVFIINETLVEFGFVLWVDSSLRFTSSNVSATWALARSIGFAVTQEDYVASCLIHPNVYKCFNITDASRYRRAREIHAGVILLYAAQWTMERIMKPWLKCALDPQCATPEGHTLFGCRFELAPNYCGCHRYDQSALNIIIYSMYPEACNFDFKTGKGDAASFSLGFGERVDKLLPQYDIFCVRRDQVVHYIPLQ